MRFFIIIGLACVVSSAKAEIVSDVQVSVTSESPGAAREQAISEAHTIAFQKLLENKLPEETLPLPSSDALLNMVKKFSIEREKTTSNSYSALMTFDFDDSKVQSWLDQSSSPTEELSAEVDPPRHYDLNKTQTLTVQSSFDSLAKWQKIKNGLESSPEVRTFTINSLSPQEAIVEVHVDGDISDLQRVLQQKGLMLTQQDNYWQLSSL